MGLCQVLLSNIAIFKKQSKHANGIQKHEKRRFYCLFRAISLKEITLYQKCVVSITLEA